MGTPSEPDEPSECPDEICDTEYAEKTTDTLDNLLPIVYDECEGESDDLKQLTIC